MPIITGLNANVFRAVSGSLFSSPINWSRGVVPTGSDVAFIADNCILDYNNYSISQLVVRGGSTLIISGSKNLLVSQLMNIEGQIACSGSPLITLIPQKSIIRNISPGTSTFYYSGSVINQIIAGGTYYNLYTEGPQALKKAVASGDLIVSGNFYAGPLYGSFNNSSFDLGPYNLTVLGTASVDSTLVKSKFGYMTFEGPLVMGPGNNNADNGLNLLGNPIVEFKRGITYFTGYRTAYRGPFNTGESIWKFSTNNQEIKVGAPLGRTFAADILISGPITASYTDGLGIYVLKSINGDHPSSSFINAGALYLAGSNITPMITGTFDYLTYTGSTIGYVANLSQTLPYNTYANLYIDGIGTKTLSGSNTTVRKILTVSNTGTGEAIIYTIFNVSSSNLIVSGATYVDGKLNKTGPGSMLFMGTYYQNTGLGNNRQGTFDFSGNPTVEFQNGFETGNAYGIRDNALNTGTGSWIFSTNNQNFNIWAAGGGVNTQYISASIVVSGSITVKYGNTTGQAKGTGIYFLNKIDGTTTSSLFINSGSLYFASAVAASASFLTGTLDTSYPGTTIGFVGDYSATLPSRITNNGVLYNLVIGGNGVKTLTTSSYVSGGLSIVASSNLISTNLELGSHNLIVSGVTYIQGNNGGIVRNAVLSKTGSGNVTFIGNLNINFRSSNPIDFTVGNPNVECRAGITTNQSNFGTGSYLGSGTWSFTENQTLDIQGNTTVNFTNIYIAPGKTLNVGISGSSVDPSGINLLSGGTINGGDSLSVLKLNKSLNLYSTSSLMTTGVFDYLSATASYIGYLMSDNYTLPYTNYNNIGIGGIATKFAPGNMAISGTLYFSSTGAFDLGPYNLTVATASIPGNNFPLFKKAQPGSITFTGPILLGFRTFNSNFDFSGNPTVEVQGGIVFSGQGNWSAASSTGTGSWSFTTRNQSITDTSNGSTLGISGPVTINNIQLTVNLNTGNMYFYNTVNGTTSNSRLITTLGTVYYNGSQQPMLTGSVDFSSSLNTTFVYNTGSQDVRGGVYRNLTFLNGLKTLQGNVSVLGTFSTGSGATSASINLNGFTLTNP